MSPKRIVLAIALLLGATVAATAVRRDASTTSRSCADVLQAQVCTWAVMQGQEAVELGATVPMSLLESVTTPADMIWPPQELVSVPVPEDARQALGFDHMAINWEAFGHPPESFVTPHFDFHFYNVSSDAVGAIDCSDESKPSALPSRYALPDIDVPGMGEFIGLCVPHMGMHAMLSDEVDDPAPFEASLVVGYYAGRPIFIEPMVSRDELLKGQDFSLPMPAVGGLPAGVRYPTRFRAEYDQVNKQYQLIFSGFGGKATE